MEKIFVNWENMDRYSSVPLPYRFVDQAEVIPGKEAWGKKMVSTLDWFFPIHFPGDPIMPGVLLMEVMQQTGMLIVTVMPEWKARDFLLHSCESIRMYRSVRPGDVLSSHVILESYQDGVAKYTGCVTAHDDLEKVDKTVCTMRFALILQENMSNMVKNISGMKQQYSQRHKEERKTFDWSNMDSFTCDPIGYRFVDKVEVFSQGNACGEKNLSLSEWYYALLAPDNLMMPTAFILEAIMQTCVFAINCQRRERSALLWFNGCQDVSFYRIVRPGEQLITHAAVEKTRSGVSFCSGFAAVREQRVCDMKFTLIAPESLVKVKV